MGVQSDKIDFTQPDNQMSRIAEEQRRKLFAKNDFNQKDQYTQMLLQQVITSVEERVVILISIIKRLELAPILWNAKTI